MLRLFRNLWSRTTLSLLCMGAVLAILIPFKSSAINRTQTDRSIAWTLADMRLLEQPNLDQPAYDLFGAATRTLNTDLQIRLEIFDSLPSSTYDLYLALDTTPGGTTSLPIQGTAGIEWDYLLAFPADGSPSVTTPAGDTVSSFKPRIVRDTYQDTVTISINKSSFPDDPDHYTFQAILTLPGETAPLDSLGPVSNRAWVYQSAPLLLTFWDTLPSTTPAQTLRRWDGAHTGPKGSRNGLKNILQASANYQIPVALLDLKTPETLSGLDYIGGMDLLEKLQTKDLLILPDVRSGELSASAISYVENVYRAFDLPTSQLVYTDQAPQNGDGYTSVFAQLSDPTHVFSLNGTKLIPLPVQNNDSTGQISDTQTESADSALSLDVRRQLIDAALNTDPDDIVVLGGSLSNTIWGDITTSGPIFSYIANHPWIHVFDEAELLRLPASSTGNSLACADLLCLNGTDGSTAVDQNISATEPPAGNLSETVLAALEQAPAGEITDLAWRMYANLTAIPADAQLSALRENYLGQIQSLILAAEWAQNPSDISTCSVDADLNGTLDCILASDTLLAVFQPQGGRLVFAFYRDGQSTRQIIGPASQFSVGISDPSTWDLSQGPLADPNEIPGAFTETDDPLRPYQPSITPGELVFTAVDGTQKTYTLTDNDIRMEYSGSASVQFQIPLVVAPEERYGKNWTDKYSSQPSPNQWVWGLAGGLQVTLDTQSTFSVATFKDSYELARNPEDPNQDYPAGHYLPFPLALATVDGENHVVVDLTIR